MTQLRGQRVAALNQQQLQQSAVNVCKMLGFEKKRHRCTKDFYAQAIERLFIPSITLSVVDDNDWNDGFYGSISGHCDPHTATITIPGSIYDGACAGERHALNILFHEIGHLALAHQPALHFSSSPATKYEDAEWQADMFASCALTYLGYVAEQQSFDFE